MRRRRAGEACGPCASPHLPTTAPAGGIVHLILPNLKWYQGSFFPLDEVLCELGSGLGDQQKLDVLLMGAAMAAMCATEKQPRGGGP